MEKAPAPVFVQNPDGSLAEGVPPGYEERAPPGTPRRRAADAFAAMSPDVVRVLARHETIFLCLLLLLLVVELTFEVIHIRYHEDAIFELCLVYPSLTRGAVLVLFWLVCATETIYDLAFFCLGVVAAFKSKQRLYQRFSTLALMGTLGQLPLAYLNRFNLLIFFLRFISYAFARFQWNLLQGIALLREELIL
mmetsp:Transcript_114795/g.357559  ORF Transcript_114795/g.357559 Transcript_114795/m.357559 type:complete len:193 (+) Transcript_114795:230-808(+)